MSRALVSWTMRLPRVRARVGARVRVRAQIRVKLELQELGAFS